MDQGIILNPSTAESWIIWVDASLASEWWKDEADTDHDATTTKSSTLYVLLYVGYPIIWASKLEDEIALPSTKAE